MFICRLYNKELAVILKHGSAFEIHVKFVAKQQIETFECEFCHPIFKSSSRAVGRARSFHGLEAAGVGGERVEGRGGRVLRGEGRGGL
ncbi:unnamed protein product [Danaus chrysippus]|uniref:(African queen) hypothetical protein n=1 Tax=Danaus chrysippus TaxID=151541 RepID=A0A8J2QUG1_9NEOP|nr:unnamed protein product [Danaus chrysippus]